MKRKMKSELRDEIVRLAAEQKSFKQDRRVAALLASPERESALARTQSRVALHRAKIRATLLAYAMHRGMPLSRVEPSFRPPGANPWPIKRVLESYGRDVEIQVVRDWLKGAVPDKPHPIGEVRVSALPTH